MTRSKKSLKKAKSQTISVKVLNPGPEGVAVIHPNSNLPKGEFCVDADQVRRLYYKVLGIKMFDERPLTEIVATARGQVSVDVPEDILRVEAIMCTKKRRKASK